MDTTRNDKENKENLRDIKFSDHNFGLHDKAKENLSIMDHEELETDFDDGRLYKPTMHSENEKDFIKIKKVRDIDHEQINNFVGGSLYGPNKDSEPSKDSEHDALTVSESGSDNDRGIDHEQINDFGEGSLFIKSSKVSEPNKDSENEAKTVSESDSDNASELAHEQNDFDEGSLHGPNKDSVQSKHSENEAETDSESDSDNGKDIDHEQIDDFDQGSLYEPSKDSENEAEEDIVSESDYELDVGSHTQEHLQLHTKGKENHDIDENSLTSEIDDSLSDILPDQSTCTSSKIVVQFPKRNPSAKRANKYHSCVFCGKVYFKLPRHLETLHYSEPKVIAALAFAKKSKNRKLALLEIQNLGDYNHNIEVLKAEKGVLIPKYTTRKDTEEKKYQSYVPCKFCLALYVKDELWKHQKRCKQKPADENSTIRRTPIQDGKFLLPVMENAKQLHTNILMTMKDDDIKEKIIKDRLVLEFGKRLNEGHGHEIHQRQYISQKMRELGRFLIAISAENIKSLEESLMPENWEILIKIINDVAGLSSEKGIYRIPSLALKLGHSLKKCAKLVRTKAIQNGEEDLRNRMQSFLDLFETEWKERVSSKAHSTLHRAKFNRPQILPLVEDVVLLHKYLNDRTKEVQSSDLSVEQKYRDMAAICLTRVILFNRKRSGEAQRIKLENYESVIESQAVDEEILKSITPFEKELCQTHKRIEIMGKRGSRVPVILTKKMMSEIQYLLQLRKKINVPNNYLFGKPESQFPLRGNDCLRRLAYQSGAKNPDRIKSTNLRKQMATLSQVLGLTEGNLDVLAKFMGHDIRVHREFYRLPESSFQLAKVSKILHAINEGRIAEFRGKNLDEIEFDSQGKFFHTNIET